MSLLNFLQSENIVGCQLAVPLNHFHLNPRLPYRRRDRRVGYQIVDGKDCRGRRAWCYSFTLPAWVVCICPLNWTCHICKSNTTTKSSHMAVKFWPWNSDKLNFHKKFNIKHKLSKICTRLLRCGGTRTEKKRFHPLNLKLTLLICSETRPSGIIKWRIGVSVMYERSKYQIREVRANLNRDSDFKGAFIRRIKAPKHHSIADERCRRRYYDTSQASTIQSNHSNPYPSKPFEPHGNFYPPSWSTIIYNQMNKSHTHF